MRHGFPFSTYGETALILVQNIAIASLVLKYSGNSLGIAGWAGGLTAAGAALFNESWVGEERLSLLQATAGVLGVASKVPQILTIWTEGGTGQLSAFAVSSRLLPIRMDTNVIFIGRQLPPRFPFPNLHHATRSRRPAHSVRLHRGLRAQPRSLPPSRVLLERPGVEEH